MKDVSYRADIVEAYSQCIRNMERLTRDQWTLIHSFTPPRTAFTRVAAEIFLDLLNGAETHDVGDYKAGAEAEAGLARRAEGLFADTKGTP